MLTAWYNIYLSKEQTIKTTHELHKKQWVSNSLTCSQSFTQCLKVKDVMLHIAE